MDNGGMKTKKIIKRVRLHEPVQRARRVRLHEPAKTKRVRLLTEEELAMRPKLPRRGLDELILADDDVCEAFAFINAVKKYVKENPRAAKHDDSADVESYWWRELIKRLERTLPREKVE